MSDPLNVTDNSYADGAAPDFGGKFVEPQEYEDQNLLDNQANNEMFIASAKREEPPKSQLLPMSPIAASSVVINLLLATGPFTYPYGYSALGPILSTIIMFVSCFLAYITATWMVEAISIANAVEPGEAGKQQRRESLFHEQAYRTPQMLRKANDADQHMKESTFYIRQKLELGVMADRFDQTWLKITIMVVLIFYMYGAMCLKYVAGAQSLYQGVSFIAYGDINKLEKDVPEIYYVAIAIFASLSLAFSFGDIENSKGLQIFSAIMRIVTL